MLSTVILTSNINKQLMCIEFLETLFTFILSFANNVSYLSKKRNISFNIMLEYLIGQFATYILSITYKEAVFIVTDINI